MEKVLRTKELWYGNEDNYDAIVIPWKAAATSNNKYAASGPIAYLGKGATPLGRAIAL